MFLFISWDLYKKKNIKYHKLYSLAVVKYLTWHIYKRSPLRYEYTL